jgi:hypothetical protein
MDGRSVEGQQDGCPKGTNHDSHFSVEADTDTDESYKPNMLFLEVLCICLQLA